LIICFKNILFIFKKNQIK